MRPRFVESASGRRRFQLDRERSGRTSIRLGLEPQSVVPRRRQASIAAATAASGPSRVVRAKDSASTKTVQEKDDEAGCKVALVLVTGNQRHAAESHERIACRNLSAHVAVCDSGRQE